MLKSVIYKIPNITLNTTDSDIINGNFKVKIIGLEYNTVNWNLSSTDWTIVNAEDEIVFQSLSDTTNKTEIQIDKTLFTTTMEYTVLVKLHFTNKNDNTTYDFILNQYPYVADETVAKKFDIGLKNNYVKDLINKNKSLELAASKILEQHVAAILYFNAKEYD